MPFLDLKSFQEFFIIHKIYRIKMWHLLILTNLLSFSPYLSVCLVVIWITVFPKDRCSIPNIRAFPLMFRLSYSLCISMTMCLLSLSDSLWVLEGNHCPVLPCFILFLQTLCSPFISVTLSTSYSHNIVIESTGFTPYFLGLSHC